MEGDHNLREEARRLAEQGRLIDDGFDSFRRIAIEDDATDEELGDLRAVFFAGAKYLLNALDLMIDPQSGPTPADSARLFLVGKEIDEFFLSAKAEHDAETHAEAPPPDHAPPQ